VGYGFAVIADVNWLLSALAQATAAMIAIVGGLLVSRYVSLHAEQQGARRRVEDLSRREEEASVALASARERLDAYYVDDVLDDDDVLEEILRKELKPTARDILDAIDYDGDELNSDILNAQIEVIASEMATAIGVLLELVPEDGGDDEWATFRRKHGINVERRNVWEWVYGRICDERRRAAAEAARKANPWQSSTLDLARMARLSLPSSSFATHRLIRNQQELAQIGALKERVSASEIEVRALNQERRLAVETYEATRQPEGFTLALRVLTILAVAGMGPPVILMGFAPMSLPGLVRAVVIAFFTLGVGLLLRFLFVYAAFLREGGREKLPRGVLGLIWRE
jgi:hypothetical protein